MLWLFPSNSLSLTFPSWLYFLKSTLEFSWWNSMWLPHKLSMKCSFAGIRRARVSISHFFRRKNTAESVSWKIKWQKVLKVCNIINSSEYVIENSMRTHASFIQWKGWHSFAIILNDENQLSYDPCGPRVRNPIKLTCAGPDGLTWADPKNDVRPCTHMAFCQNLKEKWID